MQRNYFSWSKSPVSYTGWNNWYSNETQDVSYEISIHRHFSIKHVGHYNYIHLNTASAVCLIVEKNMLFTKYKNKILNKPQPIVRLSQSCTLLLVSNLAKPQWLSVKCNKKLLPNIICQKKLIFAQQHNKTFSIDDVSCKPQLILFHGICYLLFWFSEAYTPDIRTRCNMARMNLLEFRNNSKVTQILKIIYTAIRYQKLVFLSLHKNSFQSIILRRYWSTIEVEKKSNMKNKMQGWIPCYSLPVKYIIKSKLVFKCRNNQFISTVLLCDGQNDCSDQFGTDELICRCSTNTKMYCSEICLNNKCECSQLYYVDRNRKCLSYTKHLYKNLSAFLLSSTESQYNIDFLQNLQYNSKRKLFLEF